MSRVYVMCQNLRIRNCSLSKIRFDSQILNSSGDAGTYFKAMVNNILTWLPSKMVRVALMDAWSTSLASHTLWQSDQSALAMMTTICSARPLSWRRWKLHLLMVLSGLLTPGAGTFLFQPLLSGVGSSFAYREPPPWSINVPCWLLVSSSARGLFAPAMRCIF